MPALTQATKPSLGLSGLDAETQLIGQYFALFNLGKFQQAAQLFEENGQLYPPFESPVVGPEAIATYLIEEADGMQAEPLSAEVLSSDVEASDKDGIQIKVWGQVKAMVFQVKVAWEFHLTEHHKIQSVRVNLLASLGELLDLRSN